MLAPWKKSYDQTRQCIKSSDITLQKNVCLVKAMVFLVVVYGCENSTIKKTEHWRIDGFELWCWRRFLRVEIQPVHPNGTQSWIFIGRTDAEAETPILWPPDVKSWLIGQWDPDDGKDWRQVEKGKIQDDMVGWHHWLKRHELEQALGVGDVQGSLACYNPWCCKESDTT